MRYEPNRPFCRSCETILDPFEEGEEPHCDCSHKPEIVTWADEVEARTADADEDVIEAIREGEARRTCARICAEMSEAIKTKSPRRVPQIDRGWALSLVAEVCRPK